MSRTMVYTILCLLSIVLALNMDQDRREQICAGQRTCSSCLQTPMCAWCAVTSAGKDDEPPVRCVPRNKYPHPEQWCPKNQVYNKTSTAAIKKNDPLSSVKGKEVVQVRPQKISLRLRKGEERRITLQYSQAQDYPVDLYYIMDLSASMWPYKKHLAELGRDLASAMRNLTSNFRLGFGSFVDKVLLPMTDTRPTKLKKPCDFKEDGKTVDCAPPYGFKHQLTLTEDADSFQENVKKAPISGNLDGPEGGLDAMMQSIVCKDRIGWRMKARHLLVFSTDASFHLAGDGRLAGIIEPNDCQCHLDQEGEYSYSHLQDYPSVSQIDRKAREHNVHIIFAVPETMNNTYQQLSSRISLSSIGVIEKSDTDNVINLIKGEYEKLVESIELEDNAPKNILSINYFSRCLNKSGNLQKRSQCKGIRYRDTVEFEIAIEPKECPADRSQWKQQIEIKPKGLNESLTVEIELICDCECDDPQHKDYKKDAKVCSGQGSLICGVCSCNPGQGITGKYCNCQGNEAGNTTVTEDCRAPNDDQDCSGLGTCKCGSCECNVLKNFKYVHYGKYCECNNFSCRRNNAGELCSGHGDCICGTCDCYLGWRGESCDCHDNSTCYPPGENSEICSGHGDCECGKCQCKLQNDILYSGPQCQYCKICPGDDCKKLQDCVECFAYESGPNFHEGSCQMCFAELDIEKSEKIEVNQTEYKEGVQPCYAVTSDGCRFSFKYRHLSKRGDISVYRIVTQTVKNCPASIPVIGVAIGVLVSTVILGFLILLIWKILTMVHDQREYAKFEKERAMAKWQRGDNPLYKQATTTFCNPTFTATKKA